MPFTRKQHDDAWAHNDAPLDPPRPDTGINRGTTIVLILLTFLLPIIGPLATLATCMMRTPTPRSRVLHFLALIMLGLQIIGLLYFTPMVLSWFGVTDPAVIAVNTSR